MEGAPTPARARPCPSARRRGPCSMNALRGRLEGSRLVSFPLVVCEASGSLGRHPAHRRRVLGRAGADSRPYGHAAGGTHGHADADRGAVAHADGRADTRSGPNAEDAEPNPNSSNPSNIDSNGRPTDFHACVTHFDAGDGDIHPDASDNTSRLALRDTGRDFESGGGPRRSRAARQRRPGADRDGRVGAGVRLPRGDGRAHRGTAELRRGDRGG